MKFLSFTIISAALLLPTALTAQSSQPVSLNINVMNQSRSLHDAMVLIYHQGHLIDKYNLSDKNGNVSLDINEYYTIEMQSEGYHPKQIKVNTYVLGELSTNAMEFDVELLPMEEETQNPNSLPVALIRYDQASHALVYDRAYSEYVKQKLALH